MCRPTARLEWPHPANTRHRMSVVCASIVVDGHAARRIVEFPSTANAPNVAFSFVAFVNIFV
jgi:hypothetical protein